MNWTLKGVVLALIFCTAMIAPFTLFSQESEDTQPLNAQENIPVDEQDLVVNDAQQPAVQLESELTTFSVWDFLRMVLVLAAVIAVIYALFLFLKRIGNPKSGGGELITLLASQPLSGSRALHLVGVGNEVFLIGSADGGVSLVSKVEDKETLDRIALFESGRKADGKSFAGTFRSIFGDAARGNGGDSGALFLQKQRDRLKKL